jgi:peptide/nickel transport system permease protein
VLLITVLGLVGPQIAPYDPIAVDTTQAFQAPGPGHWLGTDDLGRDVSSRILAGAQVSLSVALLAVAIGLCLGVSIGLTAGYAGGALDLLMMRLVDGVLAFPPLLLAIAITSALGPQIQNAMLAIGIVSLPLYARLTRGQVLAVRGRDYVVAARALGASPMRLVALHIFPSVRNALLVQVTLSAASAILAEATLAYLGLSTQPPNPSWGQDVNYSQRYLSNSMWWMTAGPGAAIFTTVLSLNLLGDGLRDALDPQLRRSGGALKASVATVRLARRLT